MRASAPTGRSELREKGLGRQQPNSAVLFEREEVPSIAGHEGHGSCLDRDCEDGVVGRVARYGGNSRGGRPNRYGGPTSAVLSLQPAPTVEAELVCEHAIELFEHKLLQYELELPGDRLLDHSVRRAVGDRRRDEHVRVPGRFAASAALGSNLIHESLHVLGSYAALFSLLAPVTRQVTPALLLDLAAKGVADELALRLAPGLGQGLGLSHQIVG